MISARKLNTQYTHKHPSAKFQVPTTEIREMHTEFRNPGLDNQIFDIRHTANDLIFHCHINIAMNDNPSLKTNIIRGSLSDHLYLHPFNTKVSGHPAFTVWFPKIDSIMNVSSTCDIEIKLWRTWALAVTHGACEYTEQKFNAEKTGGDPVIPSPHLDTDLVMACDRLVNRLIKAYKNPSGSSCKFGQSIWSFKFLHHSLDGDWYRKI